MCPHVSLQVEGVVEALPAEPAGVSLEHTVALEVTRQHALQGKHFMTHGAQELRRAAGFTRLEAERETHELPEDADPNPEDLQRIFTLFTGTEASAGGGRALCAS